MHVQDTWEYVVISTVVFGLCFAVTGCLVCRHLFLVCREHGCEKADKAKDEESYTRFDMHVIDYGTFISVFSFWAISASVLAMRLFTFARVTGLYPCHAHPIVSLETFAVAKYAMYAVFVARIRVCFDNSIYAYSKRTIHAMYAAVVIAFVVFTCAIPVATDGKWQDTDYAANGRRVSEKGGNRSMAACVVHMNDALMPTMVLFDFVFSILVVVMFTRPLKAMFKNARALEASVRDSVAQRTSDPKQAEFELLPLKCTLLSGLAIASTFFAMAVSAAAGIGILFLIDNSVNVACLLAMTARWEGFYWRVCGPLLRCLSNAPCVAEHNRTNIVAMTAMHESISSENR